MVHKTSLALVIMIGAFSRSYAFVRSPRPRSRTRFAALLHRQSSLPATATASYQKFNSRPTRVYPNHQRQYIRGIDATIYRHIGTLRSRSLLLHLSSHVYDQHNFGTTTTTTTASSSENDQPQQPFTWSRLIELFRKSSPSTDQQHLNNDNTNYIPSNHPSLALFRRSAVAQKSYEEHKQYLATYWKSPYDYMVIRKFGGEFGFVKEVVSRYDSSGGGGDDRDIIDQTEDECTILANHHVYRSSTSLSQASKYAIEHQITYLSLVLNEFPYDVEEGIEHWCLWKIGGSSITEGIVHDELVWALRELQCLRPDESSGSWCIYHRGEGNAADVASSGTSLLDKTNVTYAHQIGKISRPIPIVDTFYWVNPPHLQSMPEIHHAHILVLRSDEKSEDADWVTCPPPPV